MIYISPRSDLLPVNQSSTEMKTEQILVMCHRFASCLCSSRGQKRIWLSYSLRLHCVSYRLGPVSSSLLWLWCVYAFLPLPFGHKSVQSCGPKGSTTSRMAVGQKPRRHSVSESLCLGGKNKKGHKKGGQKGETGKTEEKRRKSEKGKPVQVKTALGMLEFFAFKRFASNSFLWLKSSKLEEQKFNSIAATCMHTYSRIGRSCMHTYTHIYHAVAQKSMLWQTVSGNGLPNCKRNVKGDPKRRRLKWRAGDAPNIERCNCTGEKNWHHYNKRKFSTTISEDNFKLKITSAVLF